MAAIAKQYGLNLKAGVDPILVAVGQRPINFNQQAGRGYSGVLKYAKGGIVGPEAYALATGGLIVDERSETFDRTAVYAA